MGANFAINYMAHSVNASGALTLVHVSGLKANRVNEAIMN